ncbi:MAG: hypothetical protein O3A46_10450, partial [Candidatus Poribacteria bacterium]|nr:hypothetical protein [Candidatus Poribacteria bacterium]
RGILPGSLIEDLRRVTDRGRELARERQGAQTQRFQPVASFDVDQQPFIDYGELAVLNDAIHRTLSPRHWHADRTKLGVLLEPAEAPWCTNWHRDWLHHDANLDRALWDKGFRDINIFNQVNCALYEDSSTWVVPGSHLRDDLPREHGKGTPPDLKGLSNPDRERVGLEYCLGMPDAMQLHLNAGDFALYRASMWHIGNYVPYRKRATLHDHIDTPEFIAWRDEARKKRP